MLLFFSPNGKCEGAYFNSNVPFTSRVVVERHCGLDPPGKIVLKCFLSFKDLKPRFYTLFSGYVSYWYIVSSSYLLTFWRNKLAKDLLTFWVSFVFLYFVVDLATIQLANLTIVG